METSHAQIHNQEEGVRLKILMLEDSREDISLIQRELKRAGLLASYELADAQPQFEKSLDGFVPDLILCDHSLPMFNSFEALTILKNYEIKHNRKVPIILVTGTVSEEFASQCIQAGADDYVLKDRLKRLPEAIRGVLEKCKIENERKSYLANVIASEALMKEAEQLAHFGIWKTDIDTGTSKWSDEIFRIFGYEPGEIETTHKVFLAHIHPEHVHNLENQISKVISELGFVETEVRIAAKEGGIKYVYCRLAAHRNDSGIVHLTGFCLDITKRRSAENLLEQANQISRVGGWEVDVIREKLIWSDVTLQIHEVEHDFIPDLGTAINFYKEGDSRNGIAQAIALAMKNGTSWDLELQLITQKGHERWVRAIGKAEMRQGVCVRLFGSFQDIHDRKQAQIALEDQNRKLQEIAWIQSHEVRGPLSRIMGLLSLIFNKKDNGISQADALKKLSESALELDVVVKKVVRISEGK